MTKKELQEEFSSRVCQKMRHRGMTQTDLARRANISEPTISRYISGQRIPNIWVVVNIANVLQCPPSELIDVGERGGRDD